MPTRGKNVRVSCITSQEVLYPTIYVSRLNEDFGHAPNRRVTREFRLGIGWFCGIDLFVTAIKPENRNWKERSDAIIWPDRICKLASRY